MKLKDIFIFIRHSKSNKIKSFGLYEKSDENPVDLNHLYELEKVLPVYDNNNDFSMDQLIEKLGFYGLDTTDNARINFLGVLVEDDVKYNCYEIDCTDIKLDNIRWFDAKNIVNVQSTTFLALIFRLFFRYYFQMMETLNKNGEKDENDEKSEDSPQGEEDSKEPEEKDAEPDAEPEEKDKK